MSKISVVLLCAILTTIYGCQKLSSVPTEEDNFIIIPPTNLQVLSAHDASILVSWNPLNTTGFSYYKVYFGTNRTSLHFAGETSDNYFFVDSLSYDSTYYFQITAVYANGDESGPSNFVSAQPKNYLPPLVPIGLNVQGHNDGSGKYMMVIWSANPDGDLGGYEVYRDTTSTFQPDTTARSNLLAILRTNVYKDTTNLALDKPYYYRVVAFDFAHWRSTPSQPASDMILERPTLVSPANGSTLNYLNTIAFKFNQVQGANGYILYVSTSQTGGEVFSATIPSDQDSLIYSGSSLNFNQLYFWHVAATTLNPNMPNSVSDVYSFVVTQ